MTSIKSEFNRHQGLTPEQRAKIASLYKAGVSVRYLKERFGSRVANQLKSILAEHNVPVRPRTGSTLLEPVPLP